MRFNKLLLCVFFSWFFVSCGSGQSTKGLNSDFLLDAITDSTFLSSWEESSYQSVNEQYPFLAELNKEEQEFYVISLESIKKDIYNGKSQRVIKGIQARGGRKIIVDLIYQYKDTLALLNFDQLLIFELTEEGEVINSEDLLVFFHEGYAIYLLDETGLKELKENSFSYDKLRSTINEKYPVCILSCIKNYDCDIAGNFIVTEISEKNLRVWVFCVLCEGLTELIDFKMK